MKMSKQKKYKTSFSSDIRTYIRGMKIAYKIDKGFFFSQIFNAFGHTIRQFVTSIMAAIIIDGVARGDEAPKLIRYALIVVGANLIANVIVQYTAIRRWVRKCMWPKFLIRYINGYSEKMDYWRFEDTETKEKWERIKRQTDQWQGIGICHFTIYFVTNGLTSTLTSLGVLTTMLFSKPAEPQTGIMYLVNSPFMIFIFASILVFSGIIAAKSNTILNRAYRMENDYWGKEVKRYYAMWNFASENKKSMDGRIYGMGEIIDDEIERTAKKHGDVIKKTNKLKFSARSILYLSLAIVKALSYCLIGLKALSGAFGLGSVVLYVTTLMIFSDGAQSIGNFIGDIRSERPMFDDQFSYIDMPRQMYQGTLSVETRSDRNYNVEFRNVSFKYPGCNTYALRNINIKFNIGERLAVVGMNGSGKTTFIKLLCRLYDPTEGEILLNGIDIRKYNYDEYMAIFSVVFQDFRLFSFPLAENVAASRDYDVARVEK